MKKYEKEVMQVYLDNEQAVLDALKRTYKESLDEINSNILNLMARDDADLPNVIYQIEYQKALKTQVNAILDTLQNNEFNTVSEYLTKSYEDGFVGTMYSLQNQGIPLVFPIDQSKVAEAIKKETKLSQNLYDSFDMKELKKNIANEISRGIASAMTYNDIARNISNRANVNMNNAMRIARTEGHRINIQASLDASYRAKDKGADVVKQWDASLDSKTRPHHRELDGQVRELDKEFEYSGGTVEAPAMFGNPAEDCNCRCVLLQRARWALGNDITKYSPDAVEEISDDGVTKLAKIKAKDYDEFKKKYMSEAEKMAYEKRISKAFTQQENEKQAKNILMSNYDEHRRLNNLRSTPSKDIQQMFDVKYGNIDKNLAYTVNSKIEELVKEYDSPLNKIRLMDKQEYTYMHKAFAYVSHVYETDTAELVLNPTKFADRTKLVEKMQELKKKGYSAQFLDKYADQYVVTHEFAHTLLNMKTPLNDKRNWVNADYKKIKQARKEIEKVYNDYKNDVEVKTNNKKSIELEALNSFDEKVWENARKATRELENIKISSYSLESSDEFLAESFAAVKLGATNNQYALECMKIIDKYFKKG